MSNPIEWRERNDSIAYLRPKLDGAAVDVSVGTWQWLVKPNVSDGGDTDADAILTVTTTPTANGSDLEIVDDPDDPGTDIFLLTVVEDDMPVPGRYRHRLDQLTPAVTRWQSQVLDIADL